MLSLAGGTLQRFFGGSIRWLDSSLLFSNACAVGKASSIGYLTIGFYTLTTAIASTIGLIAVVIFKPTFDQGDHEKNDVTTVMLGCNTEGFHIAEQEDGSLMCKEMGESPETDFTFTDLSNSIVMSAGGARDDISMSETVYR